MTAMLALDLSKANAGWAAWDGNSQRPIYGSKQLGYGKLTDFGLAFARVHELMEELRALVHYDLVDIEKPLDPAVMSKNNGFDTPFLLYGLAAHAHSYCTAMRVRTIYMTHQATWRKGFMGTMKRGTVKKDLKALTIERCQQLGFSPKNDDEADALGILDSRCGSLGIIPPWRANEVLRPPLGMAR